MIFLREYKKVNKSHIKIKSNECKGCRVCVEACPKGCISMGADVNSLGYQYAKFDKNKGCSGCALCFYVCPEFGAITVYKDEDEKEEGAA